MYVRGLSAGFYTISQYICSFVSNTVSDMIAIIVSVLCVLSLYIWCKQKTSVWSKQRVPNCSYNIFEIVKFPFFKLDLELVEKHGKVVG